MINTQQREFLYFLGYFYLQHGKTDKAAKIFRALLAASPDDEWRLRLIMAQTLLAGGQFDKAFKEAEKAMVVSAGKAENRLCLFLLARISWNLNRKEESREFFKSFLEIREN